MKIAPVMVIVALVLVTFVVAGSSSDAQGQQACPAGTTLSGDGSGCVAQPNDTDGVNDNVTTTTSCLQGVLSDDGQFCIVPRIDQPAPPAAPTTDAPVPSFTG